MVGPSIISNKQIPLKFLCSYGGKILPRHSDGKLRYYGGETRVLSVDRCISFSELVVKLGEMCGALVSTLRCQLPREDLDSLVSITCDEDLANLIEEYDHVTTPSSSLKIRAFLSQPKSTNKKITSSSHNSISSTSSTTTTISNNDVTSPSSFGSTVASPSHSSTATPTRYHDCPRQYKKTRSYSFDQRETLNNRCIHQTRQPMLFPICHQKVTEKQLPQYAYYGYNSSSQIHLIHHGNHWQ